MFDEKLSALMDDELDTAEVESCMHELSENDNARRVWTRQHLVRAVLKDQATEIRMDLAEAVMAAVDASESATATGRRARILPFPMPNFGKAQWAGGLALAASIAAVAFLVPATFTQSTTDSASAQFVSASEGTNQRVANIKRARATDEARRELQRYLLDHESLASEHGLSGQRSYMRVASPSTAYVTYTPER